MGKVGKYVAVVCIVIAFLFVVPPVFFPDADGQKNEKKTVPKVDDEEAFFWKDKLRGVYLDYLKSALGVLEIKHELAKNNGSFEVADAMGLYKQKTYFDRMLFSNLELLRIHLFDSKKSKFAYEVWEIEIEGSNETCLKKYLRIVNDSIRIFDYGKETELLAQVMGSRAGYSVFLSSVKQIKDEKAALKELSVNEIKLACSKIGYDKTLFYSALASSLYRAIDLYENLNKRELLKKIKYSFEKLSICLEDVLKDRKEFSLLAKVWFSSATTSGKDGIDFLDGVVEEGSKLLKENFGKRVNELIEKLRGYVLKIKGFRHDERN